MSFFTAIPVPAKVGEALQPLQTGVSAAAWHPIPKMHLTLAFFGDIADRKTVSALKQELVGIKHQPIDIRLNTVSWFGGMQPQALVIDVARNPDIDALAKMCGDAAAKLGLPIDLPTTPHITLAYVKKNCSATQVGEVLSWQAEHGPAPLPSWQANQFTLLESGTKQPDGGYRQHRAFNLV